MPSTSPPIARVGDHAAQPRRRAAIPHEASFTALLRPRQSRGTHRVRTQQKAKRRRLGKRPRLTPERSYDVWGVEQWSPDPIDFDGLIPAREWGRWRFGLRSSSRRSPDAGLRLVTEPDRNKPCRPERGGKSTPGGGWDAVRLAGGAPRLDANPRFRDVQVRV